MNLMGELLRCACDGSLLHGHFVNRDRGLEMLLAEQGQLTDDLRRELGLRRAQSRPEVALMFRCPQCQTGAPVVLPTRHALRVLRGKGIPFLNIVQTLAHPMQPSSSAKETAAE